MNKKLHRAVWSNQLQFFIIYHRLPSQHFPPDFLLMRAATQSNKDFSFAIVIFRFANSMIFEEEIFVDAKGNSLLLCVNK